MTKIMNAMMMMMTVKEMMMVMLLMIIMTKLMMVMMIYIDDTDDDDAVAIANYDDYDADGGHYIEHSLQSIALFSDKTFGFSSYKQTNLVLTGLKSDGTIIDC